MGEQRRKTIIFGNGALAKLIWMGSPYIEEESGDQVVDLILQPTEAMLDYYQHLDLKKRLKNYDGYNGIRRTFSVTDIEFPSHDPTLNCMFIRCGFNWEETIFTNDEEKTRLMERLLKKINTLKREIASLESENRKMASRPKEWLKEQMELQKIVIETNKLGQPQQKQKGDLDYGENYDEQAALGDRQNV